MWPYVVYFSLSCLFTGAAGRCKRKKKIYAALVFSVLALLLPCLLAAFRDNTVGSDVLVYGDAFYEYSLKMGFWDFVTSRNEEYLFMLLVYLCSHTVETKPFYYFVIQAFVVVPVYAALQKDEANRYAWFGMLVYYLLFYAYTLNLMRQSIAVALLFWGFKFVRGKKPVKYLILVGICMLFHTTAIVGIVVYPIYVLTCPEAEFRVRKVTVKTHRNLAAEKFIRKYNSVISWIIIAATVLVLTQYDRIVLILYKLDPESWAHFYQGIFLSSLGIIWIYVILVAPVFIMYLINRKYYNKADKDIQPLFVMSLMAVILFQSATISAETYRVSLYLHLFIIPFTMKLLRYKRRLSKRLGWMALIAVCLIMFWCYFFAYEGWNSVYPYTSSLLGIG